MIGSPSSPLRFGQEVAPEGPTLPSVCSQPQPEVPWVALAEGGHQGRRQAQPADNSTPSIGVRSLPRPVFPAWPSNRHGHAGPPQPGRCDGPWDEPSHIALHVARMKPHAVQRIAIASFQMLPCKQLADAPGIGVTGLRFLQSLPPPTPSFPFSLLASPQSRQHGTNLQGEQNCSVT